MLEQPDGHRRREILKRAASLFRRSGFERTTLRQIAAALAITSGSLFYSFESKEELLVTLMEEGIRDVHEAVAGGLVAQRGVAEKLVAMASCHLTALLGSNRPRQLGGRRAFGP